MSSLIPGAAQVDRFEDEDEEYEYEYEVRSIPDSFSLRV